jgi:acyl carrier protein
VAAAKYVTLRGAAYFYNRTVSCAAGDSLAACSELRGTLPVNVRTEVLYILETVLNLKGRSARFDLATPLLGSIPELDSMAVVSVITSLEERFGFAVDDDELDGSAFLTVGSLVGFVEEKVQG